MITIDNVLLVHSTLSRVKDTPLEIINPNMLESAIAGQQWYDSTIEQIAHVSFSINAYHVFRDGNKRTAYMLVLEYCPMPFNEDKLKDCILSVAKGEVMSPRDFADMLRSCVI